MKKLIFTSLLFSVILSCSNDPMDRIVDTKNFDNDFIELKKVLNKDEINLLQSYIFLKGISGGDVSALTYQDLLDEAIKFEEEEKAKKLEKKRLQEEEYTKMVNEMYDDLKDK